MFCWYFLPQEEIDFVLISEKIELCATSYSTNLVMMMMLFCIYKKNVTPVRNPGLVTVTVTGQDEQDFTKIGSYRPTLN